jgi:FdhD protein
MNSNTETLSTSTAASTKTRPVLQWRAGQNRGADDVLIVEEPLEIRLDGRRFTATMRTPGHDMELTRGLLFTEGVVQSNDDIEDIVYGTRCRNQTDELINVVNVILHDTDEVPAHLWERTLISNSSCGLCGKGSIEALKTRVQPLPNCAAVAPDILLSLPPRMREQQILFQQTGGLHAAGLFNAKGECLALFEDIGRHNATD